MAMQNHSIIASQKRQLKRGRSAKIGHIIKPCPLNFENVRDAEITAIRRTVLDKVKHNVI